ncbi:MAG TPA: hypothetical protein VGX48_24990 [Pyrinomonadaceae bacterium]|jgi:hypothetical protein|nr:hypothetical protein [Pyrinomonadaceae bacterium]
MSQNPDERLRAYIVIALTDSEGKKHQDCKVIPAGDMYAATYSQVYGPAGQQECEKWAASNCTGSVDKPPHRSQGQGDDSV